VLAISECEQVVLEWVEVKSDAREHK
jgi:hypothetical protein